MKPFYILIILSFICLGCSYSGVKQECDSISASGAGIEMSQAQPIEAKGLSNFYKVSDDIYRSAQPEEGGMTSAKALGIKTVLSLRETELDSELNRNEGTDLNLIHLPIRTSKVNIQDIKNAMRVIRDAPKPILIHCRHGADRTGLIVAMYRMVFENWPKACAKSELVNGDFGYHSIWQNVPKEIDKADIAAIQAEILGNQ